MTSIIPPPAGTIEKTETGSGWYLQLAQEAENDYKYFIAKFWFNLTTEWSFTGNKSRIYLGLARCYIREKRYDLILFNVMKALKSSIDRKIPATLYAMPFAAEEFDFDSINLVDLDHLEKMNINPSNPIIHLILR